VPQITRCVSATISAAIGDGNHDQQKAALLALLEAEAEEEEG